ncbi:Isoamyl acetate-hydrolyzing esterase [Phytophthora megakarya]|uniref:Isoamyl acetate-hydrolyzing esterase n=1 Tax=Phytophthora megakarya TaxID=4795 RepID=A0A225UKS8_9STRA|nr:Isoamyl acetate-hydrolyzing esterase [Phytophthora megakarya]
MASLNLFRVLLLVATVASNASWSIAQEAVVTTAADIKPNRPQILFTGDSITEQATDPAFSGYVLLAQYELLNSLDFIIRGLSGYNTRWWLKYVQPTLNEELKSGTYKPFVITIWLGSNDATLPDGRHADMHVPLEDYSNNLLEIVASFRASVPDANIVMITPPPVDDAARAKEAQALTDADKGVLDRSNAMAGQYARACVEAAAKAKVPVLDLYSHFNNMTTAKRNSYLQDGLHFSKSGHVIVFEMLLKLIRKEFPDVNKKIDVWQYPFVDKWRKEDPWNGSNRTATTS